MGQDYLWRLGIIGFDRNRPLQGTSGRADLPRELQFASLARTQRVLLQGRDRATTIR